MAEIKKAMLLKQQQEIKQEPDEKKAFVKQEKDSQLKSLLQGELFAEYIVSVSTYNVGNIKFDSRLNHNIWLSDFGDRVLTCPLGIRIM